MMEWQVVVGVSISIPVYLPLYTCLSTSLSTVSVYLSVHPSVYLICLSIYLSIFLSIESIDRAIYLMFSFSVSVYLYVYSSIRPPICPSFCLSISPSIHLSHLIFLSTRFSFPVSVQLSVYYLSVLSVFSIDESWKGSCSARLSPSLKAASLKAKLLCQTSSKVGRVASLKAKLFCETSVKDDIWRRTSSSQFQYDLQFLACVSSNYCPSMRFFSYTLTSKPFKHGTFWHIFWNVELPRVVRVPSIRAF